MNSFFKKGFTLIELLVVIAILGILAAALIATIDPFEQIKKANDANLKNISVEFVNANIRYYSNHNVLPWYAVSDGGTDCYSGGNTLDAITIDQLEGCIDELVSDGELKAGFSNSQELSKLSVTNPNPQTGNTTDSIVCFQPESRSQQSDPNTRFNADGTDGVGCISEDGSTPCYWCAQ